MILAFVTAFVLTVLVCAALLPLLRRLQVRQIAYEDAPQSHQTKTGTPTMGGIAFLIVFALVLLVQWSVPAARDGDIRMMLWLFILTAGCALVGFVDDMLGIIRGRNAGLRALVKYALTTVVAFVFLQYGVAPYAPGVLFHAGGAFVAVPYWIWLALGLCAVTGTIHAVNLTDGLDGLAAGTCVPPFLALASVNGAGTYGVLGAAMCLGFLVFNRHPAKMFMGDTGSLALGALLSGIAIVSGEMLLLIVIGGVFVAEALSVIMQVTYFKMTHGKRIFKMSPLHHHFELCGWPETKVTVRFWLASLVLSGLGFAIVR